MEEDGRRVFSESMAGGLAGKARSILRGQSGMTLMEVAVAVAILGIIGVAFIAGLGTNSRVLMIMDERESGRNLAENQMEYVKELAFASSYAPAALPVGYPGFSAQIEAETTRDANLQKITVSILSRGRAVAVLEDYKVNR
jgi:prepilin-type N-terminal cleavage/methylation domain-containing protein